MKIIWANILVIILAQLAGVIRCCTLTSHRKILMLAMVNCLRKLIDHWCNTHKLRRTLHISFVQEYIDGKCPMYLNDLFAVNTESNSRKLKMLVQSKYNSKYGCKCIRYQGPSPLNRVDNKFKLTAIFNECLGVNMFFLRHAFPETPVRYYVHLCSSFVYLPIVE